MDPPTPRKWQIDFLQQERGVFYEQKFRIASTTSLRDLCFKKGIDPTNAIEELKQWNLVRSLDLHNFRTDVPEQLNIYLLKHFRPASIFVVFLHADRNEEDNNSRKYLYDHSGFTY